MRVEVDQSGKIGDTKVPTVLAFSNSVDYAILISAKVKRELVKNPRRIRKRTIHTRARSVLTKESKDKNCWSYLLGDYKQTKKEIGGFQLGMEPVLVQLSG